MKSDSGFDICQSLLICVTFAHHNAFEPERISDIAVFVLFDNDFVLSVHLDMLRKN